MAEPAFGDKEMTGDYFNEHADTWDETSTEQNIPLLERTAGRLQLKPGMTVLDVGTGTGVFLPHLVREVGVKGRVIALDMAEKMLARAHVKHFSENITFICACVRYVPLEVETCDAVVCYSSFPHFQNKPKALAEIKRILKKNGRLFVCHTSSRATINKTHMHVAVLHHDMLPEIDEMETLLKTAGYADIRVEDADDSYFASARRPA
jgi:ubiquinone/menaquinone biosynthesis C-methylase UbiE